MLPADETRRPLRAGWRGADRSAQGAGVHAYPTEIYGGLVAVIFAALGIYFGLRLARARQVVVVKEVRVPEGGPFSLDLGKLKELGITQREHEILGLIALR